MKKQELIEAVKIANGLIRAEAKQAVSLFFLRRWLKPLPEEMESKSVAFAPSTERNTKDTLVETPELEKKFRSSQRSFPSSRLGKN